MTYSFEMPGDPVPKGRPRIGKGGHAFTPQRTRDAEAAFGWAAKAAALLGPLAGPLRVEVTFALENRRRVDLDNLAKLALDALNGLWWADDSQIAELRATKRVVGKGLGSTTVRAETMDPAP